MLDSGSHTDAQTRLRAALKSDRLAPNVRRQAEKSLARLQRGVRIAVLGPKGIGKSHLSNALLQQMPTQQSAAPYRLFFSEPEADSVPADLLNSEEAQKVQVTSDILKPGQLLDFHSRDASKETVVSILDHVDIVIWCTQSFSQSEAAIWSEASDPLKDHSFLVLTKADQLAESGELQDRISCLQDVASEEFHSFFPTMTAQVISKLATQTDVGEKLLAASGVKALHEALLALVEAGQRADIDSAMLFLERHGIDTGCGDVFSEAQPVEITEDLGPTSFARTNMLERAFDLAELTFDEAEGDMTEVLQLCSTILDGVVEDLSSPECHALISSEWMCAFEDAADKIVLLGMENDTRSAADAATILLQVRRDLDQMSA